MIIKLGTNDSKPHNWQHGSEFKHDLMQMLTTLRPDLANQGKKGKKSRAKVQPRPRILLCTPIPAFKSSWDISDEVITNEIIPTIKQVATECQLEVVDLHSLFADDADKLQADGIHPNDKGVQKMAEVISDMLKSK